MRSLIAPRSCSATAARMWTVSLLACGLSAAMNSTLLSMSGNERQIAGQAVELGDDELALVLPAGRQGLFKLGAGVALAALDLGMLGDELPGAAVEIVLDGRALGVEAKPGLTLLVRGHPRTRAGPTLRLRCRRCCAAVKEAASVRPQANLTLRGGFEISC